MARTCIDWQPDDTTSVAPRPLIVHVTKVPPSSSGIARHAGPFDSALDRLGDRETIGLGLDAPETQRIAIVLGLVRRVTARLRSVPADLVVIDLSGRALAEFFSACRVAAMRARRRPVVWLVVHDAPELVGAPMLFSFLDRKGGRRFGMALSRSVGRILERWLVRRADAVLALSELGAAALRQRYHSGRVWSIPHPAELLTNAPKQPVVYCPATLTASDLVPTLQAFESGALPPETTLRVGNLPAADQRQVERWCRSMRMTNRVEFTRFLDQNGLDESFATAAVVVRHSDAPARPANWAAASGPLVSALAAGCAVLSTSPRGSLRCLEIAGCELVAAPEHLPDEIVRVMGDLARVRSVAVRATDHIRSTHVPEAVARYLATIWRDTSASCCWRRAQRTQSTDTT
jgi:hypothetical protein